ncbi:DNA/RNA-binding protein AlbA [Candidatus Woesearchaeota archaeon]|nr:DNA/RNA-binding protein AlbA [Candidatus Woesearchaeota archaeon]
MTPEKTDNSFFVGEKPLMNYVTAAVMYFTAKNAPEITLKARGKFMGTAIDASQVITNRFLKDQAHIHDVRLGSEEFTNKEGRKVRVSTIEINIRRK